MKINFYEPIHGDYLQYVVMICHYQGKWVFCQHHTRQTLELPGGHREEGEDNLTAAKRELYEETGAIQYHTNHYVNIQLSMIIRKRVLGCYMMLKFLS